MNTRVAHKLVWWVLPLFALRGLVPAGFMIDTSQGDVSIIVCPGHAAQSAFQSTSSSDSKEDDEHQAPAGKQGAKVCPFAVAAGAGPLSSAAALVNVDAQPNRFNIDDRTDSELPFGPVRAQQSRAPPFFS